MAKKKSGFGKKFNKEQNRMGAFNPYPEGWYSMKIESVEINPTKAKDGKVLTAVHVIQKGDHKKKQLKDFICFEHPNEQTEDIAAQKLASMCDAIGVDWPMKDEQVFKNSKMDVYLTIEPGSGKYGPSNSVGQIVPFGEGGQEEKAKESQKSGAKKGKKGKKGKKPFSE